MIKQIRTISILQVLLILTILMTAMAMACGSGDSGGTDGVVMGGTDDWPKRIRTIESTTVFTEDDMKSVGWKGQRDFVLEYPGTSMAKWGFMNQKEVGVLIYANAEDAQTLGVTAADAQTFRREVIRRVLQQCRRIRASPLNRFRHRILILKSVTQMIYRL